MRKALIAAAVAALFGLASPTSAATELTTATTLTCGTDCDFNDDAALVPFDSDLGTLTAVILKIDVSSVTEYNTLFADFQGPDQQTGTAELAFHTTFDALMNGVTYSLLVGGSDSLSVSGTEGVIYPHTFTMTGSGTFVLDPSLFSTFVDVSTPCGAPSEGSGICVRGAIQSIPFPGSGSGDFVQSSDNLVFLSCFGTCTVQTANYSLRYVYTPHVPEPATWAMMLLGFAGIGIALRLSRHSRITVADYADYGGGLRWRITVTVY